jgi:hypothetical protein
LYTSIHSCDIDKKANNYQKGPCANAKSSKHIQKSCVGEKSQTAEKKTGKKLNVHYWWKGFCP